jgi:hypothetical protein
MRVLTDELPDLVTLTRAQVRDRSCPWEPAVRKLIAALDRKAIRHTLAPGEIPSCGVVDGRRELRYIGFETLALPRVALPRHCSPLWELWVMLEPKMATAAARFEERPLQRERNQTIDLGTR